MTAKCIQSFFFASELANMQDTHTHTDVNVIQLAQAIIENGLNYCIVQLMVVFMCPNQKNGRK